MFTKTGLRPREVQSLDARSGIGQKLPPVTTTHRRDFHADGRVVTPMSSTRRKKAGGRSSSSSSSRGRREGYRHGGGNGSRSRSQSAGGKREVSIGLRANRLTRKRPEWDDSLRDTSQYRLTAEEALRRKISLVSKHNTLMFGLGGGSTTSKKAAASLSSSIGATAASTGVTEVSRGGSSKQQHQQQSREARGGGGASAVSGGSSLSDIYGGSVGGSGSFKRKVAVLGLAPAATEADLTAAISEEGGEPASAGGVNDATMSLYTKHGGGDGSGASNADGHQDGDDDPSYGGRSGGGGSGCGGDGGGDKVESTLPSGGGSVGGREAAGASSLADLEVGIKAFSERVGRLETFRKADLLKKSTAGGNRSGGTESESEDQDGDDETDCRSHQSEDVSLSRTAVHDGPASDDPLSHLAPILDDNSSAHQLSTTTEHGGSELQDRHHGRPANPWSHSAPSSSSSFREQRRRRAAATAAQPASTSDGGGCGQEEAGLVKRIERLEEQVLGMCSGSSPVMADTTSSTAGSSYQDQTAFPHQVDHGIAAAASSAAPAPALGRELTAREEQLRGVVVDLLSLSAALLARTTAAERRVRELSRGSSSSSTLGGGEIDSIVDAESGDVYERARRVRASAEAAVVLAGDDGEVVQATGTHDGFRTDSPAAPAAGAASAGDPSLSEEVGRSLLSGESPGRVSPSPPPRRSETRSATTDCWGEALGAVSRLVDSQPSGFGYDETPDNEPSSLPSSPPRQSRSSCVSLPRTPMRSERVSAAAAVVVPASPNSRLAETGSFTGQMLPRPPQNAGSGGSGVARLHRWRAAPRDDSALFLLDTVGTPTGLAAGDTDSCVLLSRSPWAAPRELGGPGEEEEDARASPVSSAPNPSKKPQHPFRGERSTPMRSPRGLRGHVGQARRQMPVSEPRRDSSPASCLEGGSDSHGGGSSWVSELGEGGGGDGDRVGKAPRPPIGQWYTPPSLVVQDFE